MYHRVSDNARKSVDFFRNSSFFLGFSPLFAEIPCVILLLSENSVVNILKILIAVSPEFPADLLRASLSPYEVHICHDGRSALEQICALEPEVLVLDLALPDTDGITLLGKCTRKPPVILALTNFMDDRVLKATGDLGVQAVLLLPCSMSHIRQRLETLIEFQLSAPNKI